MTTRVTITNEENGLHPISVNVFWTDNQQTDKLQHIRVLKQGESEFFYIHKHQYIQILEENNENNG